MSAARYSPPESDVVVIGSGFGGAMAAWPLVNAGRRVLMLERGDWVPRGPENWTVDGIGRKSPAFDANAFGADVGNRATTTGTFQCVGGQSVFFAGVAMRFRERDFSHDPRIVGGSGASWPYSYKDVEPSYVLAERLLGVAGAVGEDPTDPERSAPFPADAMPLSGPSLRLRNAALDLGMHPFRLPLAINGRANSDRAACVRCSRCDGYACAVGAKNDLASGVLPALLRRGMHLRTNVAVVRLEAEQGRVSAVHCLDLRTGERFTVRAQTIVLAAGAIATPHLLLSSGLAALNPASGAIGRYLTRHHNTLVLGVTLSRTNPQQEHDKQLGIHDFYHGDSSPGAPDGHLGSIQSIHPPAEMVRAFAPGLAGRIMSSILERSLGLMAMAEDQPRAENFVEQSTMRDAHGLPRPRIVHRFSRRDIIAGRALVRRASAVLRAAGAVAVLTKEFESFSHACGTVRMGNNERTAPLDANGRFRGLENLYVSDASALPRSAGINPSLTIAANALRVGSHLAGGGRDARRRSRALPMMEART